MVESLLPNNSTPAERKLEQTLARPFQLPVAIRETFRPDQAPSSFVPFIAHTLSADVWPSYGDDTLKREIAKQSLQLHKLKGTPYAIRRYIEFTGAKVEQFRRPPGTAFVGGNQADDAWIRHYPQVRVYFARPRRTRPKAFFAGHSFADASSGPKGSALLPSIAVTESGKRVTLVDRGVETELRVRVDYLQNQRLGELYTETLTSIDLKRYRKRTAFAGKWGRFASGKYASTLRIADPDGIVDVQRRIITPTVDFIRPTAERVHERGTSRPKKLFASSTFGRHLVPTIAFLHVYDAYWLYVPGRHVQPRKGRFFANVSRIGHPDYTGEVKIRVRNDVKARKLFAGGHVNSDHAYPADQRRIKEMLFAVAAAKSLRDQINININCTEIVKASPVRLTGSVACGSQVEAR